MKTVFSIASSLVVAILMGAMLAFSVGISPAYLIAPLATISFIPGTQSGIMAGVYKEVWSDRLEKKFTIEDTFLDGIPDASKYVKKGDEYDIIHITDVLTVPGILIDNTTYPLVPESFNEADIPIQLKKFETVPSKITRDEIFAVAYAKIDVALEAHKISLLENTINYSAVELAPTQNTADTPIVKTTGLNNGSGFKKMLYKDLIALKKQCDKLKIPTVGRRVVLCPQHVADLLEESTTFAAMYSNLKDGKIGNLLGFDIREFVNCPKYDNAFVKRPFGSIPAGTDRDASFFFYVPKTFKAKGTTYVDFTIADALNKSNYMGCEQRFIARPLKQAFIAAIVSDTAV